MAGTLILCGTPIGNLADVSERAASALMSADLVLAEDTRRTAKLLNHLGISVPMKSFFAGNEKSRLAMLKTELAGGATVVVVSDAGMPVVSDPGASAVQAAVDAGADVTVVPGPSAVLAALAVSGFDGDRFVFAGFLPRKGKARDEAVASIGADTRTTVLFAAPSRIVSDLEALTGAMDGDRRIVVTRELTKVHEEIWRGTISEGARHWGTTGTTKGEFTVVIQGAIVEPGNMDEALDAARALIAQGSSASDAVRSAASAHGVRRSDLYERVIART